MFAQDMSSIFVTTDLFPAVVAVATNLATVTDSLRRNIVTVTSTPTPVDGEYTLG